MTKKLRLTLTDSQWVELKASASSQHTNPATMIKRLLFPKVKAVEKRGTTDPVITHEAVFENGKAVAKPLRISDLIASVDAPTIPVTTRYSCMFCEDAQMVWFNGNQIPCPRCGLRVEVTE